MRFYTNSHPYYCGIDPHSRILYDAITTPKSNLLRRRMHIVQHGAQLKTHVKNTVSQYNLPVTGVNLRYTSNHEQYKNTFEDKSAQKNIDLDLNIIEFYDKELTKVETHIKREAKQHNATDFNLLKTISGVGDILALTMPYETRDIKRFESMQKFASYSQLVKYKAESVGKTYGTSGNKIGNAHLKWAFSEASVLCIEKGYPLSPTKY